MGITETIIGTILDRLDIKPEQIDKVKEIIDMIEFTKENGKDVVIVRIGENVQLKINK